MDYDNRPVSSGPYMITDNTPGVQLVLDRNPNWDPATDPIRHQYPDRFVWSFGSDVDAATNRIIADGGDDRTAIAWDGVSAAMVATTVNDPALQARSLQAGTPSANRLTINTERVTDLKVRQALNYAINRQGLVQMLGGPTVAGPLTTIMPPDTIGFQAYDAYPAGATGDPAKAREVLAGATPNLVLAAGDDSSGQETAAQLKANLEQAGFTITVKTIPADDKFDETKKRDNPWDLWLDSWAADWPSGAAILPVLFDGRTIKDAGNSDSSLLNDDALNAEFDRIQALPPEQQASQWGPVDQQIMTDFAPAVPLYVDEAYFLHGSEVGGLFVSSVFGSPSFVNAYVTPDRRSAGHRGQHSELAQHPEDVGLRPFLGDHPVVEPVDVGAGIGDPLAGRRDAQPGTGMGAGEPVPDDQPVVAAERVLECHADVGQGSDDLVALRLQFVEPDGLGMVRHVADVPLGVTASRTRGIPLVERGVVRTPDQRPMLLDGHDVLLPNGGHGSGTGAACCLDKSYWIDWNPSVLNQV